MCSMHEHQSETKTWRNSFCFFFLHFLASVDKHTALNCWFKTRFRILGVMNVRTQSDTCSGTCGLFVFLLTTGLQEDHLPFLFHRINSEKKYSDKHFSVKHVAWGLNKKKYLNVQKSPANRSKQAGNMWMKYRWRQRERAREREGCERGSWRRSAWCSRCAKNCARWNKNLFFLTSLTHFSLFFFTFYFPAGILRVSMTSLPPLNLSKKFHRVLIRNAACVFRLIDWFPLADDQRNVPF